MTRETLNRIMKLLNIREEKWDHIANEELRANKYKLKVSFLPTTMTDLRYALGQIWNTGVKDKILPILKELLRRGGITDGQYSILVNELDKL